MRKAEGSIRPHGESSDTFRYVLLTRNTVVTSCGMALDTTNLAVICFFSVALLIILLRWPPWLSRQVFHRLEGTIPMLSRNAHQASYNILTQSLHILGGESACRYALLGIYIFLNAFLIFAVDNGSQVRRRSAVASTVNLVPAILSGRTRILIESLNISSQQHFFAHKWFARISFLEAIVHSALMIRARMPHTIQATCGLIVRANLPCAIGCRR